MTTIQQTINPEEYRDPKRWLWALAVLFPLQPLLGIAIHRATANELWLALGLFFPYIVAPLLDLVLGEDDSNPPRSAVRSLEQDRYYRYLTWAIVPLHFATFFLSAWYAATANLSVVAFLVLAYIAGVTAGLAINTGHELGHKNTAIERWLARIVLAVPAYGHFSLDHNRGHHRDVSTPEDCASARMGESIYHFALREIPGAFKRAWRFESDRLRNRQRPAWHPSNQLLQSWGLSLLLAILLITLFGALVIPFLVVHHAAAYWQLTSANYVEHYGLRRRKLHDNRYERCEPHHSWNSNHIFSNLVLFHLQRHSDHHTHPLRRYQALRHYSDLPQLPNGYFGVYLLAYVPPLWFRIMDPKLVTLPHINGDFDKINTCPKRHNALVAKYSESAASA